MSRKYKIAWFIGGMLIICLDLTTKFLAATSIPDNGVFIFNNNLISFELARQQNPFLAFGIKLPLLDAWILPAFVSLFLFFLIYKAGKLNNRFLYGTAVLVTSGALANIIDRLINSGGVTDFLVFSFLRAPWPAFNLADALITITAISFLIIELRKRKNEAFRQL